MPSQTAIFNQYSQKLCEVARREDAREESFYSALRDLLKQIADTTGRPHVHVTVQPTPTEGGNPDFRVWNGTDSIIGYIEAKAPTETNLYGVEASEQLRRYRDTFPNLLLTNFTEFRLYRNGQHVQTVHAASPNILNDLRAAPAIERPAEVWALLDQFLDFTLPQAPTAEELAVQLARRTRSAGAFTRRTAFDRIPHTIGVLRDVFRFISLEELPPHIEWIVDDIAEVLARADAPGILDRYYREGKGAIPSCTSTRPFSRSTTPPSASAAASTTPPSPSSPTSSARSTPSSRATSAWPTGWPTRASPCSTPRPAP